METVACTSLLLLIFQSHREKKLITEILLVGLKPNQPPCSAVPGTEPSTVDLFQTIGVVYPVHIMIENVYLQRVEDSKDIFNSQGIFEHQKNRKHPGRTKDWKQKETSFHRFPNQM